MAQIKETTKQYLWILLTGIIVAVMLTVITANFHVLQFLQYKMNNDTQGMVKVMSESVNSKSSKDWYFQQGMNYLVKQENYDESIRTFFEENFAVFSEETQKQILEGYNKQQLSLPLTKEFMTFLIQDRQDMIVKTYIQKMTVDEMEQGLILVYGKNPKVDEAFLTSLNELLAVYPRQLLFDKFSFSLYDVLALEKPENEGQIKSLFNKLNAEIARNKLLTELKGKKLTETQLVSWMKLLKDVKIMTLSESNQFDTLYSEICMLRTQYQGIDNETVTLKSKKEAVDAKIGETQKKLEAKQGEIDNMQSQVNEVEGKLEGLTNYAYMPLYIEGTSGTGSNEYIASVPRGGLFGILRPSSQKYIVKLSSTTVLNEGVYNLNVYLEGSKTADDGGQYNYYVEVSDEDLANIETVTAERDNKIAALDGLKQEAQTLQNEIDTVKNENDYDAVVEAINSVDSRKSEYVSKIQEKTAKIKELLGLNELEISLTTTLKEEK